MRNIYLWIITFVIAIVLIVGIFYYEIIGAVVNAVAFIISLTIIFLILILVIIFSQQDNKKMKVEEKKVTAEEKPEIDINKTPLKKLRVIRKK